jgi:iduronate 2-sulfatase
MQMRLLLSLAFSIAAFATVAAEKPNVLLICVDDLKPTLGCYADKAVKSPNFDRLAARGVTFDRAYCNQAVCAPSRNALLTGVRSTRLGIYDLGTNFRASVSNAVTLPQYFMRNGYRTEALGKIFHVGHGNHEDPASWSVPHWGAKSIAYALPQSTKAAITREEALFANELENVASLPRGAAYEAADVTDEGYPDGKIAAEAIRRLQKAKEKPSEPFFLAVGFVKPHLPFCAPKKYWDLYDRSSFKVPELRTAPEGAPRFAPSGWGELRQYSDIPATGPLADEQAITLIHGYYAAVSYMDAQLGKVLDELDRLGLAKNTIIVLWGDHGWHLGDHGWWCKHDNYEQANRIPLIVAAPGVAKAGAHAGNTMVESVDIYPTIAELAGLPAPQVPQGIDGKSFAAALRDPSARIKDHVFHAYPRGERIGRAVRTMRHRLVEWKIPNQTAETAEIELYDYADDPLETKNWAKDRPEQVRELRALLNELPEAKPQIRAPQTAARAGGTNREALFERKDVNKDGKLTRAEFLTGQPDPDKAPERFTRFDANKDGELSREEFVKMGVIANR